MVEGSFSCTLPARQLCALHACMLCILVDHLDVLLVVVCLPTCIEALYDSQTRLRGRPQLADSMEAACIGPWRSTRSITGHAR